MRSVQFDYPNTCPKIDRAITIARNQIERFLDYLLEEACPLIKVTHRKQLASDYADRLYESLEDVFEETRRTNEDMRREADRQIDDLMNEVSNLEFDLRDLQSRMDE